MNKNDIFDFKLVLRKLYDLGCRNLLVEGGNILSNDILNKRLFNKFYLFKSPKQLSKLGNYKEFNFLKKLKINFKKRSKINLQVGKDSLTLYTK